MILKSSSVDASGVTPALLRGLATADELHRDFAAGVELVVTSLNDGRHMPGSKHYSGNAADLRVWYTDACETTQEYAAALKAALGDDYDVVYGDPKHLDHIHVEFDPD